GLVDALEQEMGILSFGPYKQLARIETSKSWTRDLLSKYSIDANPQYFTFTTHDGIRDCLKDLGAFAIKPDGLTGGKGVKLSGEHLQSLEEAVAYADEVLETHPKVVIEEKLEGQEFSLQTISDGHGFVHCPLAQDHKRAYEGDRGPNTGGMGSYSCRDFLLP